MKTEVVMKRELFGEQIGQKSKSEFFNVTDLIKAGDKWRRENGLPRFDLTAYLKLKSTTEFVQELEKKYGKCITRSRGRNAESWAHPILFIDIALAISPSLKIEVYEWLFDSLIKYRNDSGDSYREASAALYTRYPNKKRFPEFIQKVANHIKTRVGVKDWQTATEDQLKTRDRIHLAIKLYSNVISDPNTIVRLAVIEGTNSINK